jgi:hypothetical protein
MHKLSKTGQWVWRTGEYGLKEYYDFPTEAKELHLQFLQTLKPEELSTNDKAILTISKVKEQEQKPFLSMLD